MATTRRERMALAALFVAGSLAGLGFAVEPAHAQFVNPVPPPPPPVFNPPAPLTVPQAPEVPVAPSLPSAPLGSGSVVPLDSPPSLDTQPPQQATTRAPAPSNAATAQNPSPATKHDARRPHRENYRVASVGSPKPSYHLPLDYHGPSCVWRPDWNGYWWPVCF